MGPQVDLPAYCTSIHVNLGEHVRRRPCRYDCAVCRRRRRIYLTTGVCRRTALQLVCCDGGAAFLCYVHRGDDVAPGDVHWRPADGRRQWNNTSITAGKRKGNLEELESNEEISNGTFMQQRQVQ